MTKRMTNREDILQAFAVEPVMDRATLERYILAYPDEAAALIDLAHERAVIAHARDSELTADDNALINAAWLRHVSIVPVVSSEVLKNLTVEKQRALAAALSVPRQVITAFRDGKILLSSVPRKFLKRFAEFLGTTLDDLIASLSIPRLAAAKSFKADNKPQDTGQVTFEQVLTEAGVDPEIRTQLLDDLD
jgi:hypothetical protein